MITIRDEIPSDIEAREALLDRAMGEDRRMKTSERLREGNIPAPGLSLVSQNEHGEIDGSVRLWPVNAGTAGEGLLLGPLAVDHNAQGKGIGKRLMREAVWRAARNGHAFVLLVGDALYYAQFGFARAPRALSLPGFVDPARFLALELRPGALNGAAGTVSRPESVQLEPSRSLRRRSGGALDSGRIAA
jgi:predicted N-acetyltransferase YhbS